MDRRAFLRSIAAVAIAAATPIKYLAPTLHARIVDRLSFSDLVSTTFKAHAAEIAANVTRDNALYRRLKR